MKYVSHVVAAVVAAGTVGQAFADSSDTESYPFDPNSPIYSEYVYPSVDSYAFDPNSAIFREDIDVVVVNGVEYTVPLALIKEIKSFAMADTSSAR